MVAGPGPAEGPKAAGRARPMAAALPGRGGCPGDGGAPPWRRAGPEESESRRRAGRSRSHIPAQDNGERTRGRGPLTAALPAIASARGETRTHTHKNQNNPNYRHGSNHPSGPQYSQGRCRPICPPTGRSRPGDRHHGDGGGRPGSGEWGYRRAPKFPCPPGLRAGPPRRGQTPPNGCSPVCVCVPEPAMRSGSPRGGMETSPGAGPTAAGRGERGSAPIAPPPPPKFRNFPTPGGAAALRDSAPRPSVRGLPPPGGTGDEGTRREGGAGSRGDTHTHTLLTVGFWGRRGG